jgi:outer membrane receptor protein involved in Fe transport
MRYRFTIGFILTLFICAAGMAQTSNSAPPSQKKEDRPVSGVTVTRKGEAASGVALSVRSASGEEKTESNSDGAFHLSAPAGPLTLKVEGKNIVPQTMTLSAGAATDNLRIEVDYVIPPVHDSVVIEDTAINPTIDRRNDTIYKNTLFGRDDQLIFTLNAGINAGQHEGGGKSLEIRRFGFNLDHGGVNGGLKALVEDVPQNQGTQGHGQGYLGQLKSLTPELVEDVDVLNGPFSAQYGDFSGLGVVHIRLKESLPDQFTLRLQGGSFASRRVFAAYSPELTKAKAFVAYDGSYTDGPFINPGRYRRDNVTGNYTRELSDKKSLGFKLNLGRNDFYSSGQIPLDLVAEGGLDRFGFIDPDDGGKVRTGVFSVYYKQDLSGGGVFKLDGFLTRSLFDLFSNFTFFLLDPKFGDEIQQHDSRLQEGVNAQYLRPYKLFGRQALLTAGANFHASQIVVGLFPAVARVPNRLEANQSPGIDNPDVTLTRANAGVTNTAGYAQQAVHFLDGHLRVEGGLRFDYFRFKVSDGVNITPTETNFFSGVEGAGRFQPKAAVAYTVSDRVPLTFYVNYGRGINSQDARGVIQRRDAPKIATTDFYQASAAYNLRRFSASVDYFVIDHSNEQVYVPDDGSFEFKGPSRATGYEVKVSAQLTKYLSFSGGLTQVTNAFYRGASPRVYVDSAPHTVADARLLFSSFHGFFGTLAYRHTGNYRLDGEDPTIRASGLDVLDLSLRQRVRSWLDVNLSIDNLADKHYFETQNYLESRANPTAPVVARIHGTPGYSRGVSAGLTFHIRGKK